MYPSARVMTNVHTCGYMVLDEAVNYFFIYMVIQEESAILWEMIVCVILSKRVNMNMGPILNGYRDMVKRNTDHPASTQQLRNK